MLVLVLVDRWASISHSSAQISRKPRVAEVTRQVADVTRQVHEMGGVGWNPSNLGYHLHGFEVPQSIPAAPQAFLGHTLLGMVIPSTVYEPFFTDADPTSHRVRLWRGGSASKVLLLRVFFPRVRPRGMQRPLVSIAGQRGAGDVTVLPVWLSTSGEVHQMLSLCFPAQCTRRGALGMTFLLPVGRYVWPPSVPLRYAVCSVSDTGHAREGR